MDIVSEKSKVQNCVVVQATFIVRKKYWEVKRKLFKVDGRDRNRMDFP